MEISLRKSDQQSLQNGLDVEQHINIVQVTVIFFHKILPVTRPMLYYGNSFTDLQFPIWQAAFNS